MTISAIATVVYVSFGVAMTSAGQGIYIASNTTFTFTQDQFGDALKEEVHGFCSAGGAAVVVLDIFEG